MHSFKLFFIINLILFVVVIVAYKPIIVSNINMEIYIKHKREDRAFFCFFLFHVCGVLLNETTNNNVK